MRFIIISIVFVLLVYGCAGNQTQRVNNEEISNEFAFEILLAKLKKNGESLICEQPGYLNCFNISSKQCYEETSPYRLECYDRASQKMPDILNEADAHKFTTYFLMCITTKQMIAHSYNFKEINACLGAAKAE